MDTLHNDITGGGCFPLQMMKKRLANWDQLHLKWGVPVMNWMWPIQQLLWQPYKLVHQRQSDLHFMVWRWDKQEWLCDYCSGHQAALSPAHLDLSAVTHTLLSVVIWGFVGTVEMWLCDNNHEIAAVFICHISVCKVTVGLAERPPVQCRHMLSLNNVPTSTSPPKSCRSSHTQGFDSIALLSCELVAWISPHNNKALGGFHRGFEGSLAWETCKESLNCLMCLSLQLVSEQQESRPLLSPSIDDFLCETKCDGVSRPVTSNTAGTALLFPHLSWW